MGDTREHGVEILRLDGEENRAAAGRDIGRRVRHRDFHLAVLRERLLAGVADKDVVRGDAVLQKGSENRAAHLATADKTEFVHGVLL